MKSITVKSNETEQYTFKLSDVSVYGVFTLEDSNRVLIWRHSVDHPFVFDFKRDDPARMVEYAHLIRALKNSVNETKPRGGKRR